VLREIHTNRMLLRCPKEGDGVLVYPAVLESLEALRAWPASLPWALAEPSVAASEAFARESAANFTLGSSFVYFCFDHQGDFIACAGLHRHSFNELQFELGYWCRKGRQAQGYTKEAAKALLQYAFGELGANRVNAKTDELNSPSRAVCESSGMKLVRVLQNESFSPTGELRNVCLYAATRSEV